MGRNRRLEGRVKLLWCHHVDFSGSNWLWYFLDNEEHMERVIQHEARERKYISSILLGTFCLSTRNCSFFSVGFCILQGSLHRQISQPWWGIQQCYASLKAIAPFSIAKLEISQGFIIWARLRTLLGRLNVDYLIMLVLLALQRESVWTFPSNSSVILLYSIRE